MFDGNDPRHLIADASEYELLGNTAQEFLTLRLDKERSKASKALYYSTVNTWNDEDGC